MEVNASLYENSLSSTSLKVNMYIERRKIRFLNGLFNSIFIIINEWDYKELRNISELKIN